MLGRRHDGVALPPLGRWKMLDNLRRSLLAPANLLLLTVCCGLPWPQAFWGVLLTLLALVLPAFLPCLAELWVRRPGIRVVSHLRLWGSELRRMRSCGRWFGCMPRTSRCLSGRQQRSRPHGLAPARWGFTG